MKLNGEHDLPEWVYEALPELMFADVENDHLDILWDYLQEELWINLPIEYVQARRILNIVMRILLALGVSEARLDTILKAAVNACLENVREHHRQLLVNRLVRDGHITTNGKDAGDPDRVELLNDYAREVLGLWS